MVQWFPKLGVYETAGMRYAVEDQWNCHQYHSSGEYYADFGNYNVKINVPENYIVGASGVRGENGRSGALVLLDVSQKRARRHCCQVWSVHAVVSVTASTCLKNNLVPSHQQAAQDRFRLRSPGARGGRAVLSSTRLVVPLAGVGDTG